MGMLRKEKIGDEKKWTKVKKRKKRKKEKKGGNQLENKKPKGPSSDGKRKKTGNLGQG